MRRRLVVASGIALLVSNGGDGAEAAHAALSLGAAYERALEESPALKALRAELQFEQAGLREAKSDFLPTVGLSAVSGAWNDRQGAELGQAVPLTPRIRKDYQVAVTARQNIFAGFETTQNYRAASAAVAALEASLLDERSILRQKVIEEYFLLQKIRSDIAGERELAGIRGKQEKEIATRIRQGRSPKLDMTLVKIEAEEQYERIAELEAEQRQAALALNRRIGLEPDSPLNLSDPLEKAFSILNERPVPTLSESLRLAVVNNPELIAAQQQTQRSRAEINAHAARYGPKVDLVFEARGQASELSSVAERDRFGYGVQLELSVPLFSGFGGIASLDSQKAFAAQRSAEEHAIMEGLLLRLSKAYRDLDASSASIKAARERVRLSTIAIDQSLLLYRNGRLDLQGVLSNNRAKQQAQRDLFHAMHRQVLAIAEINRIVGR